MRNSQSESSEGRPVLPLPGFSADRPSTFCPPHCAAPNSLAPPHSTTVQWRAWFALALFCPDPQPLSRQSGAPRSALQMERSPWTTSVASVPLMHRFCEIRRAQGSGAIVHRCRDYCERIIWYRRRSWSLVLGLDTPDEPEWLSPKIRLRVKCYLLRVRRL